MVEQKRHDEARSPRERLARWRTVAGRGLNYWKGSLLVLLAAGGAALGITAQVQRVYRSECTILAKAKIRTDDHDESTSFQAMAGQSARLKDLLTTRARLESAIRTFALYPETTASKTMLDAVEEMKPHVGFRSLEGAQYVISFDTGDPQTAQRVTQYLADTLIADFAASDLSDLQRQTDFLAEEERVSLTGLESATRDLTVFLAAHPEFALEAKQAATGSFGATGVAGTGGGQGIPLMPKLAASAASADPELAALLRERSRLEGARAAGAVTDGGVLHDPSKKSLDDQITQTQTEVEAAAKRVAETQADLASKSNLTEDHPDMRAARMAADAAARQLHEAKVKLGSLQQLAGAHVPADASQMPPEAADRLRLVDAQIRSRRARLSGSPGGDASEPQSPLVKTVVDLETEWQRMLRALSEARTRHEDLKQRSERSKLALEAGRAQASERMAILDPPYRPTHPTKGARGKVALGGLAMAVLLGIAYAALRLTLDDTLVDADDVELLGLGAVLGVVPSIAPRSIQEIRRDAI
jgi:uncharacterized protein involved in exopolysaccharide biosynthesis